MTKGGYVDSSRRIRSLHRQQDGLHTSQQASSRNGLLAAINKSSLSSSAPSSTTTSRIIKPSSVPDLPSVISVSNSLENRKKEYDKQMRLIEV